LPANPLCQALAAKVDEQFERALHLIGMLPLEALDWSPRVERPWTVRRLLAHLAGCQAGFCAALHAAQPERLGRFLDLRSLPPVSERPVDEIVARIGLFRTCVREGFDALDDSDLERTIPTVFVPEGEPLLTLLLGNFEHFVNHKHQLFVSLRLLGVDAASGDLYRFRGP
jgi:uncharacterized damage-inducible protein DinB